jgi:hypothetical protein
MQMQMQPEEEKTEEKRKTSTHLDPAATGGSHDVLDALTTAAMALIKMTPRTAALAIHQCLAVRTPYLCYHLTVS